MQNELNENIAESQKEYEDITELRKGEFFSQPVIYQSPANLAYVTALNGYVPPDIGTFKYLEIGCGSGTTLCGLATLYEKAEFWGICNREEDFERANELKKQLSLNNIHFFLNDFSLETFEEKDFDYIVLNGVYAVTNAKEQEKAIAFASSVLNPGGILYIHHYTLPGRNNIVAFWRIIKELVLSDPNVADSKEHQAKKAWEILKSMSQNFSFLRGYPGVGLAIRKFVLKDNFSPEIGEEILREGLECTAVDYFFNFYTKLEKYGFSYAGRAEVELNDLELSVLPAHLTLLYEFRQPHLKESLRDLLRQEAHRRSIFVKAKTKDEQKAGEFIAKKYYLVPRMETDKIIRVLFAPGRHKIELKGPFYDKLLKRVENSPVRLQDLDDYSSNTRLYLRALARLVASGQFFLCINPEIGEVTAWPEKIAFTHSINITYLKKAVEEYTYAHLISKCTGNVAMRLTFAEATVLYSLYAQEKENAISSALDHIKQKKGRINLQNKIKQSQDITEEDLKPIYESFTQGRKGINLMRMKIIENI
jgi:SAM-dependent methyltransferase